MVLQMAWQNSALPTLVRASNLDCQFHNASSVRPLRLGVRNSINDFIPTGQIAEKTKLILTGVYHHWNWNRGIYLYERRCIRIRTQFVTGHATLKRHLHLMGMVESPNCECGEPQEAVHLLTNCSEYRDERMKAFGHFELQPREIREYGLARLLQFAKYTGLWQVD